MSPSPRELRILSIPAGIIGVVIAIAFFSLYGFVTKPDVPTPVAYVVTQFAPGVRIGATVADVKHRVSNLTWAPHVGFVGAVPAHVVNLPGGGGVSFPQIRLVLSAKARSGAKPPLEKAQIEAVEFVTSAVGAYPDLASGLTSIFRAVPRTGCVRLPDEGGFREVHYWVTRKQQGGVALVSDYAGTSSDSYSGVSLVSVIAFTGEFRGGLTLRANFAEGSCEQFRGDD